MPKLVGNEIALSSNFERNHDINYVKNIYMGLGIIGGLLAGVWSFAANRFRWIEILWITGVGVIIGVCLGIVCYSILKYVKR